MSSFKLNGEYHNTAQSTLISFSSADLQFELLTEKDFSEIKGFAKQYNFDLPKHKILDFINTLKAKRKDKQKFEADEQYVYNFIHFKSLCNKGLMLLEEINKYVKDNILEVKYIQKEIKFEGDQIDPETGKPDTIIGYIDFGAIFVDNPHKEFVCDFKTSSVAYKDNDANESLQLTIYSTHEERSEVCFVVAEKNIRKKEPRVRINRINGNITQEMKDKYFEDIMNVYHDIIDQKFEPNLNSCNKFGGCQYKKYCQTGSDEYLVCMKNDDQEENNDG